MKKILLTAFLGWLLSSAADASAQVLEPGCAPEMMTVLQRHSDAVRVRNRAYEREILYRNESVLALTCFDQALRLSSRLGYIFSDNVPSAPPPPYDAVFGPSSYPRWGAVDFLSGDLYGVLSLALDAHMGNFPGSDWLSVPPNLLTDFFMTSVVPQIGTIIAAQDAAAGNIATINALIGTIDGLVWSLAYIPTASVPGVITSIATERANIAAAEAAVAAAYGPIAGALAAVRAATMGPATNMVCTRMADLWTTGNPAVSYALIDPGYVVGTPYFDLRQVFSATTPGALPTFAAELANATNAPILAAALAQMSTMFPGPAGALPTVWQNISPAIFVPWPTTATVIGAM